MRLEVAVSFDKCLWQEASGRKQVHVSFNGCVLQLRLGRWCVAYSPSTTRVLCTSCTLTLGLAYIYRNISSSILERCSPACADTYRACGCHSRKLLITTCVHAVRAN